MTKKVTKKSLRLKVFGLIEVNRHGCNVKFSRLPRPLVARKQIPVHARDLGFCFYTIENTSLVKSLKRFFNKGAVSVQFEFACWREVSGKKGWHRFRMFGRKNSELHRPTVGVQPGSDMTSFHGNAFETVGFSQFVTSEDVRNTFLGVKITKVS